MTSEANSSLQERFRRAVGKHRDGDLAAAEKLYRELIDQAPKLVDVYSNLAALLKATGRPGEGLEMCERALALTGANPNTFVNRGNILVALGRHEEALDAYVKALELNPNMVGAHLNLGNLLMDLQELDHAVRAFTRATELEPGNAEAHAGLGHTLSGLGRLREAEQCLRKAKALAPNYPDAHCRLGQLLLRKGELEEARTEFEEAVRVKPDFAPALRQLAESRKWEQPDTEFVDRLRAIADNPEAPLEHVAEACFALGNIYSDCSMYDEAFENYAWGNRARLGTRTFNAEDFDEYVGRLIAQFSAEFLRSRKGFGSSSNVPVFIVGMPRSGTTLVEQIVASHPQAFGANELQVMPRIGLSLTQRLGVNRPFPECAASLPAGTAAALAREYEGIIRGIGGETADRITDKMPENFLYLGLIQLLFPRARVIHCRRHPLDNGLSIFFQNFSLRNLYECDLASIGLFYRGYVRLMKHWREALSMPMLEVRYEELVSELEGNVHTIIEFLELPWDNACLDFHRTSRGVYTASARQVRKPIYTSSVGRWKNYEKHLRPLIETLGPDCVLDG